MSKTITVRARHNRNRALLLELRPLAGGDLMLVGIRPLDGPLPTAGLDLGMRFQSVKEARARAIEALKGAFDDVLEHVNLAVSAYMAWHRKAMEIAPLIQQAGLIEHVPLERGRVLEGGVLQIYVDLPPPLGRQAIEVPPGEWAWKH